MITTDPGTNIVEDVSYVVQVSDALDVGWTTVAYMTCHGFDHRIAAAGHDQARLSYQYGVNVLQQGAGAAADYDPLDIGEKFIRIIVNSGLPNEFTWYGWVQRVTQTRGGEKISGTLKIAAGQQLFECVGVSWFLDRIQIDHAVTYGSTEIERPLVFNGGSGIDPDFATRGNRAVNDSGGLPVFDDPTSAAAGGSQEWTAEAIVDYLIGWFQPKDTGGLDYPAPLELHATARQFLSAIKPVIQTDRQTFWQVLNQVISPRRGLVWWPYYDFGDDKIYLYVNSLNGSLLTLPSGDSVPANINQETWDFGDEILVGLPKIVRNYGHKYRTVRVRGARRTAMFTVSKAASNVSDDWDSAEETAYRNAANSSAGYAGLATGQKAKRNDAARRGDKFDRVYSAFRLSSGWDGKANDGSAGGIKGIACPALDNYGQLLLTSVPIRLSGLRLLNRLPVKTGFDYSTNPSNPTQLTSYDRPDFIPPFVVFPVNSGATKWQLADQLADPGDGSTSDRFTPCRLKMQEQSPGFVVQPSTGLNHLIAKTHFTYPGNSEPTSKQPELDYDDLRATLCGEFDIHAEATFPEGLSTNPLEELVIDVGPNYRFDYLAANTILGVENGALKLASTGGALRDDRDALRDLAAVAYQWYQTERAELIATIKQMLAEGVFPLGALITSIGSGTTQDTLNTVVSSIAWSFDRPQSTTVTTALANLDVRVFA